MKKRIISCLSLSALMSIGLSVALFSAGKETEKVEGYSTSSLPTTIDLNDTSAANIRSYYSSLNSLETAQRQGTNLLKNLKTILKNGQKYYSYDSGNAIWQIYEIADRDWEKSPASSTTYGTYNSSTNKITGYSYGTSSSSSKNNPYIHALYINRNVTNQTTAWDDHQQTQWGINREHVWPKAEGFEDSGAGGARGDPMHLMAGNGYANNIHSNYYYGYVNTSSSYTNCGSKYSNLSGNLRGTSKTLGGSTSVFEPQDCDKGDIARAIFYMVARYNYLSSSDSDGIDSNNPNLALTQSLNDWASSGYSSTTSTTGKMGIMTDLLAWHKADPVDEYEIHRNNLLYTNYTNNRNPFIDFPEWADYIWGTVSYSGSTYNSYSSTPTGYASPNSDTINGYNSGGGETVSVTGVSLNTNSTTVEEGKDVTLTATVAPSNATNQGVSWTTSDSSIATVSGGIVTGVSEGSATITVTTSDGGYTATCLVTVAEGSGGGEMTWTKVTDSSDLSAGDKVVIVASDYDYALSTTQNTNNRGRTAVTKAGDTVSWDGSDVQELTLAAGSVSSTFAFGTGSGYLYAAGSGSGKNYLKTQNSIDENASFTVSISNGVATLTAQGSNTNNLLKYNSNNSLFSCYASGQKDVCLYKGEEGSVTPEPTLSSIAVKTAPTKLTYTAGDGFDANGLVITATYSDSSTADIEFEGNEDAFEFEPADNLQTSDVSVTISYGGKTCTQAITVAAAKTLSSITINTDNVTKAFYKNDTFEHDNLVVIAHFSDSSSDVVSSSATVSTPDMSITGEKTITVSYTYSGTTKTASYTITVLENGGSQTGSYTWDLSTNSYSSASTSQVTWIGDCANMVIDKYNASTNANNYLPPSYSSTRFYQNSKLTFTPKENYEITSVVYTATTSSYATAMKNSAWTNATAAASNTTTTITPDDGTTAFYGIISATTGGTSIKVNYTYTPPASLSSISLDTTNVQTTFSVGDTFNYTGLVVTAQYSDLSSKTVTPTSVSSPDMSTTGNKTVTVTYTEDEVTKTETYSITVNANPSISWTAPTINVYSGSTLSGNDVNGWAVTYNDGAGHQTVLTYSQLTVKLGGTTISIPHTWTASDDGKTLTATYNSLTTSASSAVQVTQSVNTITKTSEPSELTSNLTFTAACGGSGTADHGETWTVTSDATESNFDSTKGIHYGTGSAAVEYIQLVSNSFTTGTITQVVVNASGASGVTGSVSVTVGGTPFGEVQSFDATASDKTFTGTASAGQIVVRIYKASAAVKAVYCKSVVVTNNVPGSSTVISNNVDHIAAQRAAVKFANTFNTAMDTTSGCTTNLSSAWSTCSDAYDTFLSEASALGETEAAYAKSLIANATKQYTDDSGEACIERMMKTYEVCVQKHGQTPFMSELVTLSKISISPLQVSVKNSSTTIIIVVISALSVIAIGGYFYFRKKKEN